MDFNSTTQANFPLKKKKPEEDDKADSPSLTFFTPPSKKEGGGRGYRSGNSKRPVQIQE